MLNTIKPRNNRLNLLLLLILASLLAYFCFYNLNPTSIFFANDQSTDLIIAKLAVNGELPLLGPPSHTGGRHLGPLYYWFVIFGYWLSGSDIIITTAIYSVVKLIALLTLTIFVTQLCSSSVRPFVILAAVFLFSNPAVISLLRTQWHSNYLIIPSFLAVASGGLVILKSLNWLPIFLICVTCLALSHLSAAPVVLSLTLVIFAYCISAERRLATFKTIKTPLFGLAIIVVFLLLSYPVMYELNYPSNIKKLFFTHTADDILRAGIIEAINTVKHFLQHYTIMSATGWYYKLSAILFCLSGLIVAMHLFFSRASQQQRWFIAFMLAPLLLTSLILIFFKHPLYIHYFNSSIAIPFILFLWVSAHAISILRNYSKHTLPISMASVVMIATVLVLVPERLIAVKDKLTHPVKYNFHSLAQVQEISQLILLDAGTQKPLVFGRLSARLVRNGYYYFINDLQPEAEYFNFFPELARFNHSFDKTTYNLAYVVICPKPYSFTRRDILKSFEAEWIEAGELDTTQHPASSNCSVVKLTKKSN